MLLNRQRLPTLVDVYDFNTLHIREHNANINTKNYLSSKSPLLPMSYDDLRLVVTNRIPSNILILPKAYSSSSPTSMNTPILPRQKKEHKKKHKQTGVDVYRSLARSVAHFSTTPERDISKDEMITNSLTSTRFSRRHNLPKIPKHQMNSNKNEKANTKIKTNCEPIEYMRSKPPDIFHRTTPTHEYYEEDKDKITETTKVFSYMPKNETRQQLHIYMPSIHC